MMKQLRTVCFLACVLCLVASVATAAGFDPQFKIAGMAGECTIKTPDASDFSPLEEGKSYPYGSVLKTGANASAIVQFAEGSQCTVLAKATVSIAEQARKKNKVIGLEEGTIKLSLAKKFHKKNGLEVETATTVSKVIGGDYSVGVRTEADIKMVVLVVEGGEMSVKAKPQPIRAFDVKGLEAGQALSVATSREKQWVRLKDVKGKYDVRVIRPEGDWGGCTMEKGEVIKIVITKADIEDKYVITYMVVAADGKTVKDAWTVTTDAKDVDKFVKGPTQAVEPSKMPTTTTTTTTIPSPTPVGDL